MPASPPKKSMMTSTVLEVRSEYICIVSSMTAVHSTARGTAVLLLRSSSKRMTNSFCAEQRILGEMRRLSDENEKILVAYKVKRVEYRLQYLDYSVALSCVSSGLSEELLQMKARVAAISTARIIMPHLLRLLISLRFICPLRSVFLV